MNTLQDLGQKCGTDKGTRHSYLEVYERVLSPLREEPIRILEIGVQYGASLEMWLEFFPKGLVYGIDLEPSIRLLPINNNPRVFLHVLNAVDQQALSLHLPDSWFDVVVDDGSHLVEEQIQTSTFLYPRVLKPGGFYFIEDLQHPSYQDHWKNLPGFESFQTNKAYDDHLIKWIRVP